MMMIGGAIGFYLGIDTPPLAFKGSTGQPSKGGPGGEIDATEFLSAVGTFIAIDGIYIGRRDCTSWAAARLLDNNHNGGMAGWPDDADHCRSNCTHSHLTSALGTIRRSKTRA
jgi:hypothetical protein